MTMTVGLFVCLFLTQTISLSKLAEAKGAQKAAAISKYFMLLPSYGNKGPPEGAAKGPQCP